MRTKINEKNHKNQENEKSANVGKLDAMMRRGLERAELLC